MPSAKVQAAGQEEVYKAYYEWLQKEAPSMYEKYTLIDLDGDQIPELVGDYRAVGWKIIICSYDGKKVVSQELGDSLGITNANEIYYIPGKGMVYEMREYWSSWSYYEDYMLENGKIKKVASKEGESFYSKTAGKYVYKDTYKWNKKTVSKKVYDRNYKKLKKTLNIDDSKRKSFYELKYISKSEIMKKLK